MIKILFALLSLFFFSLVSYAGDSPLNKGHWVKIMTNKTGVYKVTYSQLVEWGFSSPQTIAVYGTGGAKLPYKNPALLVPGIKEVAIELNLGSDNTWSQGDYLLFYAEGPDVFEYNDDRSFFDYRYNDFCRSAYYFITDNALQSKLIEPKDDLADDVEYSVKSLDYFVAKAYSDNNYISSGSRWVNRFKDNAFSESFQLPNVTSDEISVNTYMLVRTKQSASISIKSSGKECFRSSVSTSDDHYVKSRPLDAEFKIPSSSNVTLDFSFNNAGPDSHAGCDYITLNARVKPIISDSQTLIFDQFAKGKIAEYSLEADKDYTIWDITNKLAPRLVSKKYSSGKMSFKSKADDFSYFWAFDESSAYAPQYVSEVSNQNLMGNAGVDMVIVASEELKPYADEIAEVHRIEDGLSVAVVSQQEIFNEFSAGRPDLTAIRHYMIHLYKSDNSKLKYLLLFGDGTYDNREFDPESNYIMTYQSMLSNNRESSYTSDDFFCFLDDNEGIGYQDSDWFSGYLDISVGRMPVNDADEAEVAVYKLKKYYESKKTAGSWCRDLCFVADDADPASNGTPEIYHTQYAEIFAETVRKTSPGYNLEKIYLDGFSGELSAGGQRYPSAEKKLSDLIKNGVLAVSFSGHGSPARLTQELLLTSEHVTQWKNIDRLPFFITASCEISVFDDPKEHTLGEALFNQHDGGCIALLSSTRTVYASPNRDLVNELYPLMLQPQNTIGEAVRLAKNKVSKTNTRKYVLLGDPALKLNLPQQEVVIDKINGIPVEQFTDTVKALDVLEISGSVLTADNFVDTSFNGRVYLNFYDKLRELQTMGNAGNDPIPYMDQTNVVFKGKSTVVSGKYKMKLVVPKDIISYYGRAKLSLFANDDGLMASGVDTTVVLGGLADVDVEDYDGPELQLFMNDTNFVSGGNTNQNPDLLVRFVDSSGINLASGSIGHSAVAVLDGEDAKAMELNSYYVADLNTYQKGWIKYPLKDLEDGFHSVSVKVWDVLNNSSENMIDFYVTQSAELVIADLMNCPNPVYDYTRFSFEHNQPGEEMSVKISIISSAGNVVAELKYNVNADGFKAGPFEWDGTDMSGNKISQGVYYYTVEVETAEGSVLAQKSLVVIR